MASDNFNKKQFILLLHDAYVNKYISTNLLCHVEFFRVLRDISKKKKPEDILGLYDYIKKIFSINDLILPDFTFGQYDMEVIKNIIFTSEDRYEILNGMKGVLKDGVFIVLNYIYGCILKQENTEKAMMCVAYLLDLKPKDIGSVGTTSMHDILFNLLTYVSKLLDKNINKYVLVSRELMYFNCRKKELKQRERLIYVTLHVITTNCLDTSKLTKPSKESVGFDYLFVLCEKDYVTRRQIDLASDALKGRRVEAKNVYIEKYEHPRLDIVKI